MRVAKITQNGLPFQPIFQYKQYSEDNFWILTEFDTFNPMIACLLGQNEAALYLCRFFISQKLYRKYRSAANDFF